MNHFSDNAAQMLKCSERIRKLHELWEIEFNDIKVKQFESIEMRNYKVDLLEL